MSKVDCRRRARSKATSSMTLTGYLHSFKCRLKLENGLLRLFEGSKSLPSFRFRLRINLQTRDIRSIRYLQDLFGGVFLSEIQ